MTKSGRLQPENFVLGRTLPLPHILAATPYSMPKLVSASGYQTNVQYSKKCSCVTKVGNSSVAFVPRHVGSAGAKWSGTDGPSQCFLVALRLDVKVYGNAHQVFELQRCTICIDQVQNRPTKSPQNLAM